MRKSGSTPLPTPHRPANPRRPRRITAAGGSFFCQYQHQFEIQALFSVSLTRNPRGIEVFKEAEKKAMEVQEAARAEAQQRKRVARKGQTELFGSKELHDSTHYESLRERYLTQARDFVLQALKSEPRLLYDDAWILALSQPLVWESDLKEWIAEWKEEGRLEVAGMQPRQKVPHRNESNYLIWK